VIVLSVNAIIYFVTTDGNSYLSPSPLSKSVLLIILQWE